MATTVDDSPSSKSLIWNFEIINTPAEAPYDRLKATHDPLQWEARYFWPENQKITLHGLDESYLNLSRYTYKHREDTYMLLDNGDLNIKKRRNNLFYKPNIGTLPDPLLGPLYGFGKKINLHTYPADALIPEHQIINTTELLKQLLTAKTITVNKELVIYTFHSNPPIQLELSRLTIKEKH